MHDDLNRRPFESDTGVRLRQRGLGRVLGIAFMLMALLAGVYLIITRTADVQRVPPHLIGSVWTARAAGTDPGSAPQVRIYFITREDRMVTRAYDPQGQYAYDHTYSIFRLHARAAADGGPAEPTAEVELARIDTTSVDFKKYQAFRTLPDGPGILGPQDDVLWVWNSGLEARDARTLAVVWTAAQLKGTADEGALPDDPKYFRVLWGLPRADGTADAGALAFKSADARFFQVDRKAGKCVPLDEALLAQLSRAHTKTADTAFETLGPSPWGPGGMSLASVSASGLIHNAVLDDGVWRALLTADQRAALNARVGVLEEWDIRQGLIAENASSLYSAPVSMDPSRIMPRTSMMIELASVQPAAAGGGKEPERFLTAGFLRRPGTHEAWATSAAAGQGPTAKSFIVLHRKAIGDQSPWMLTRLGVDGAKHWTTEIGLTELDHVSDGGTSIVVTGRSKLQGPQAEWPEHMVFVDEATGTLARLNVAECVKAPAGR